MKKVKDYNLKNYDFIHFVEGDFSNKWRSFTRKNMPTEYLEKDVKGYMVDDIEIVFLID